MQVLRSEASGITLLGTQSTQGTQGFSGWLCTRRLGCRRSARSRRGRVRLNGDSEVGVRKSMSVGNMTLLLPILLLPLLPCLVRQARRFCNSMRPTQCAVWGGAAVGARELQHNSKGKGVREGVRE
jgi:hypothetical protein